ISDSMIEWAGLSIRTRERRAQLLLQLRLGLRLSQNDEPWVERPSHPLGFPVLVAWGKHDRLFPVYQAYRAAALLGANDVAVFNQSGHLPHLEEPDLFLARLRQFLENAFD